MSSPTILPRRGCYQRASAADVTALAGDAIQIGDPPDPPAASPDRGDDYLIALARAAHADVIVSGDSHLTRLTSLIPPVLTPRQFLEQLG